jgi:hypothetical protein
MPITNLSPLPHSAVTLLALLAAAGSPVAAQTLTNHGARLAVQPGTTLAVPDSLLNRPGSQLANEGTLQVGRTVRNAGTLASGGLLRFSGAASQRLVPGNASLAQLEVDNAGPAAENVLLVTNDLAVTQQLRLTKGLVRTLPAATIHLPNGASLAGEGPGQYVQGNLRVTRTAVNALTDFGHGAVLDGTGQPLGEVSILRTAGLQMAGLSYGTNVGGAAKSIDRIWTVSAPTTPTRPVPLTLSWSADDDNQLGSFATARVWQQDAAGTAWKPTGPAALAGARRISTATTAWGRFTVSNPTNPLPVELLSFTVERAGDGALLRWATASEHNNAYFTLERSLDGRSFTEFGRRDGKGTSAQRADYQLNDNKLARHGAEVIYYRLRQVDVDGTATYAPVQSLRVGTTVALTAQAWPNPFDDAGLQVQVQAVEAGAGTLVLIDALGRPLVTQITQLPKGTSTLAMPEAGKLPEGVYWLRITQGRQQQVIKVVRH